MATRLRLPAFGRALPWGLAALSLVLAFGSVRAKYTDTRIELRSTRGFSWTGSPPCGARPSTSATSRAASSSATCSRWGRITPGRTRSGCRPGSRTVLAGGAARLAALGVGAAVDALYSRRRGVAHPGAAVLFLANPYVVVHANRGTVTLLAYAALPWILLAAHRGWGAARVALAGGARARRRGQQRGVNAAMVFWIAAAPLALVLYEVVVLRARRTDAVAFAWRAALLAALASAWWIVPVLIQSGTGRTSSRSPSSPRDLVDEQHVGVAAAHGVLAAPTSGPASATPTGLGGRTSLPDQRAGDRRDVRGAAAGLRRPAADSPAGPTRRSSGCSPWAPCWSWPRAFRPASRRRGRWSPSTTTCRPPSSCEPPTRRAAARPQPRVPRRCRRAGPLGARAPARAPRAARAWPPGRLRAAGGARSPSRSSRGGSSNRPSPTARFPASGAPRWPTRPAAPRATGESWCCPASRSAPTAGGRRSTLRSPRR